MDINILSLIVSLGTTAVVVIYFLASLTPKMDNLKVLLEKNEKQIEKIEDRLSTTTEKIEDRLSNTENGLNNVHKLLIEYKGENSIEIEKIKSKINTVCNKVDFLKEDIKSVKEDVKNISISLDNQKDQINDLKTKFSNIENLAANMNKTLEEINKREMSLSIQMMATRSISNNIPEDIIRQIEDSLSNKNQANIK